jgi:hypothetical protein
MRVRDGRVQKKNNWRPDLGDYRVWQQDEIQLDRRPAGKGFRHLLTIGQLRDFVELLPDWQEVAVGLDAIVLDEGQDCMGWHDDGVVAVCAWEQELWWEDGDRAFEEEHRDVLNLLGVEREVVDQKLQVRWTEHQARAFQLLHILPHELGHHHDRITTRRQRRAGRGEPYAEAYSLKALDAVWPAYAPVRRLSRVVASLTANACDLTFPAPARAQWP